jgi:serine/threonine-protein kinase
VIATARSGSGAPELSRAGWVLGTPSFMAPEQARGEIDQVDERVDVFALGSILCEVVTGQPAFVGRKPGDVQRKAALGDTAEALARLDASGADADLIGLDRDCLARKREDRPRNASAVAERVTAYLAGVQQRLHASERERAVAKARAVEERRKRRWQLGLAASIAASLLLGGLGLATLAAALDRQKAVLAQANTALDRQRRRAEANEAAAIDAVKRFRDAVANNPGLKDNPRLEPLEAHPKLADDRRTQHPYNAACAAALAAAGRGEDDLNPDAARAELRRRALSWHKGELAAWSKALDSGDPKARAAVAATLRHWRDDPDLAGVREADALAALPEAERRLAGPLGRSGPLAKGRRKGPLSIPGAIPPRPQPSSSLGKPGAPPPPVRLGPVDYAEGDVRSTRGGTGRGASAGPARTYSRFGGL